MGPIFLGLLEGSWYDLGVLTSWGICLGFYFFSEKETGCIRFNINSLRVPSGSQTEERSTVLAETFFLCVYANCYKKSSLSGLDG